MIDANYRVRLDACVLASHSVCDLLPRLAEERLRKLNTTVPRFAEVVAEEQGWSLA